MRDLGVYTWAELVRRGVTQAQARRAVADGSLVRLRRGWYATPSAHPLVVTAVLRGGVLSCVSALRMHGLWVPEHAEQLHVRANRERQRVGRFCSQHGRPEAELGPVDEIPIALRHAARCLDHEGLIVVCDSIIEAGHFEVSDLRAILAGAPEDTRRLLDRCDGSAQSGIETMVRLRLRARRVPVRTQVSIPGVGRVDLLVGDRLIVEVDGRGYHSDAGQYTEDRRRDRAAVALGYTPIRLTYDDVVHRWPDSEAAILDLVRTRRHRARRSTPRRHNPHR